MPPTTSVVQISHGDLEQHRLDELVRHGTDDGGGQEGNQHGQHEAAGTRIARQVDKQPQQLGHVDRKNGQDRAELDQHLEGLCPAK